MLLSGNRQLRGPGSWRASSLSLCSSSTRGFTTGSRVQELLSSPYGRQNRLFLPEKKSVELPAEATSLRRTHEAAGMSGKKGKNEPAEGIPADSVSPEAAAQRGAYHVALPSFE